MPKEPKAKPNDPIILNSLTFAAEKSKVFAISSLDKEPTEELLKVLTGVILIFAGHQQNPVMDQLVRKGKKEGRIQECILIYIHHIAQVSIILKRDNLKGIDFDAVIVDRLDMLDNTKSKMQKGSLRAGMIAQFPVNVPKSNIFITTCARDVGLFEAVDTHYRI